VCFTFDVYWYVPCSFAIDAETGSVDLFIYLFIRVTGLSSNFSSLALMNSILIYIISFILAWKYRSVKGYRGCTLYREYKLLPISCAKIRMRWCRLQRANIETNCFFKIWLLEKMRGKIIGRCSTLEHMDCRAFPPWLERPPSFLLSFVRFSYQSISGICLFVQCIRVTYKLILYSYNYVSMFQHVFLFNCLCVR